jgi:hypothetical protein
MDTRGTKLQTMDTRGASYRVGLGWLVPDT